MRNKEPKITIAEQDIVDSYTEELKEFMSIVFEINSDECLITDESELYDFCPLVIPDNKENDKLSYNEAMKLSEKLVKEKIKENYNIEINSLSERISTLIEKIVNNKKPTYH